MRRNRGVALAVAVLVTVGLLRGTDAAGGVAGASAVAVDPAAWLAALAGLWVTLQQVVAPLPGGSIVSLIPVVAVAGTLFGYVLYRLAYGIERSLASGLRAAGSTVGAPLLPAPDGRLLTEQFRVRTEALHGLLAVINVGFLLGLVAAAYVGRPRFFGLAIIGFVAILLLNVLVVGRSNGVRGRLARSTGVLFPAVEQGESALSTLARWSLAAVRDRRFAVSALLSSVGVLATLGPGLVYFLLVALFVTSLVVHVYLAEPGEAPVASSLALLAVGAGLTLLAQALTVPFYVRTLDTLYHTALARRIANVGSLAPVAGTRYEDLPVLHTLAAVCIQVVGGAPRTVLALLFAGLFPVAVLACFAVVRNVAGSATVGFVAAGLLAINPEFIRWGVQAHVQSLSFFLLAVFLVVHTKRVQDVRYTALAVGVALVWTMTHHLSVFMAVVLIAVWNVAGTVWLLVTGYADHDRLKPPLYQYTVFVTFVAVYWWLTGLYRVPISWITRTSVAAQEGAPTTNFLIRTFGNPVELTAAAVPFLIDNLHYAPVLALGGYAVWTIIRPDGRMPSEVFPKVLVGFLVAIPLYVPNPAWILGRGVAALNRWGIMTLPFLLPVVALGLVRLSDRGRPDGDSFTASTGGRSAALALAAVVVTMAVLSVGGGFTDPSLADSVGQDNGARKFYTEGNLDAADHLLRHTGEVDVRASHAFAGYLIHQDWTGADGERSERFRTIQVREGRLLVEPGLTVVEAGSLQNDRIRLLVQAPATGVYQRGVEVLSPVSAAEAAIQPDRRNVVYDNSDTYVVFEPPAEPDGDAAGGGAQAGGDGGGADGAGDGVDGEAAGGAVDAAGGTDAGDGAEGDGEQGGQGQEGVDGDGDGADGNGVGGEANEGDGEDGDEDEGDGDGEGEGEDGDEDEGDGEAEDEQADGA